MLIAFSVAGTYAAAWFILNKTSLWLVVDRSRLQEWQRARLVWAFVFSVAVSALVFSRGWWEWLLCADVLRVALAEIAKPLRLSMWVWAGLGALWFFGALKKAGILTTAFIVFMLVVWTVFSVDFGKIELAQVGQRLRYLAIPLVAPWVVFGLLLVVVMIKEMMTPNANFILSNVDWADYREVGGLWGLWFPRWFGGKRKEVEPRAALQIVARNRTRGKVSTQEKRRYLFAPAADVMGVANFARALLVDTATFSEKGSRSTTAGGKKGAVHFGYTPREFVELRETARVLGLIEIKGKKSTLTDLGIDALVGIVERVLGPDAVPGTYSVEGEVPQAYQVPGAAEGDLPY